MIMKAAWAEVKEHPGKMIFLGCEHPAVITLGRQATKAELVSPDLNFNEAHGGKETLDKGGGESPAQWPRIPVFQTDRGGQATLHSEGQLVIYPIVHLRALSWGIKDFIDCLLQTTSSQLQSYGISTELAEPAGLQTPEGKIAFMGLRVDQGVTRHGLSLNIGNDLTYFDGIRACGVHRARLSKVADYLERPPSVETAFKDWQAQLNLILKDPLSKGSVGAVGSAFP